MAKMFKAWKHEGFSPDVHNKHDEEGKKKEKSDLPFFHFATRPATLNRFIGVKGKGAGGLVGSKKTGETEWVQKFVGQLPTSEWLVSKPNYF